MQGQPQGWTPAHQKLSLAVERLARLQERLRVWQEAGYPARQADALAGAVADTASALSDLYDDLCEQATVAAHDDA